VHVSIGKGTVNEISSDLADVEAKLKALTADLHDAYTAQTTAVQSAVDKVKSAVSDLSANPSTSAVKDVATAFGGLATATGNLLSSLSPQCGSSSVSPSP
jgi:hypothetical protein